MLLIPVAAIAGAAHDAILEQLHARVDALERRLADIERRASPPPVRSEIQTEPQPEPTSQQPPQRQPQRPRASANDAAAEAITGDDDMARALERALVREGGLLLPAAALEVEPRLNFRHASSRGLELLASGGQPLLAHISRRREVAEAALGIRIGLPAPWQFDLLLPYLSVRQQGAASGLASSDSVSGFGAAELGVSWQLRPVSAGTGIVVALRRIEPGSSGFARSAQPLAGGLAAWQASLLFVARRDPVVFFGALSQTMRRPASVAGQAIDAGNATGVRAGAIIALSPETSLRLGLDLQHAGSTRIAGALVAGSGGISGEFSGGFSYVLSPRVLLGVEAGIGLTRESPDFRIGLSMPVRF